MPARQKHPKEPSNIGASPHKYPSWVGDLHAKRPFLQAGFGIGFKHFQPGPTRKLTQQVPPRREGNLCQVQGSRLGLRRLGNTFALTVALKGEVQPNAAPLLMRPARPWRRTLVDLSMSTSRGMLYGRCGCWPEVFRKRRNSRHMTV